jgi:acetolactate synthase-1/2/3 large subunit
MVRQWQELFFEKRYSFTELKNPDFVAVAKGFHINAEKVSVREDLSKALDTLINAKGPQLLEIVVRKEENVFPMVPSGAGVQDVRLE